MQLGLHRVCLQQGREITDTPARRSFEELQQLVLAAGLALGDAEFEGVFEAAAQACGQEQYASLDAFLKCRHTMLARQLGLAA